MKTFTYVFMTAVMTLTMTFSSVYAQENTYKETTTFYQCVMKSSGSIDIFHQSKNYATGPYSAHRSTVKRDLVASDFTLIAAKAKLKNDCLGFIGRYDDNDFLLPSNSEVPTEYLDRRGLAAMSVRTCDEMMKEKVECEKSVKVVESLY